MKKILVLIVLLFLASCKKKSDSNLFMLGFLGILAEEPPVEVTVGGTVSGLSGSGLVLQNNGGDDLPISANGTFQFSSIIFEGGSYNVTVLTHPSNPSQTCEVSGGIGQALNTAITTVTVNCSTNSYSISGSVSGLASTGLTLTNGTDTVTVASNGTFAFPTTVPSGSSYNVTMTPSTGLIGDGSTTGPLQSCTLTNGGGIVSSATVSNISLVCVTTTFNIRVNVAGYTSGSGMVLQNNLGDDLTVAANTTPVTFATKIASGSSYSVTVKTQPSVPSFICSVSGGSGVVTTGDVSSITVNCSQAYTVGGTTSGLAGSGLVLQNTNNGETVSISSTGTYAFATPLIGGTGYSIAVLSQPTNPWQTCLLTGATGTIATSNVTNVNVSCTTNSYKIGGTVTGLASGNSITLQLDGGDSITRTGATADGSFTFATSKNSGTSPVVSISASPSLNSPSQTCRMTYNGTTVSTTNGNTAAVSVTVPVLGSAVSDILINCSNLYSVSGTITGLDANASGMTLALNGSVLSTVSGGDTSFSFPVPDGLLASGDTYEVTVQTQPTPDTGGKWQNCAVSLGTGTISADVSNVVIACTTSTYTIGGTIVGLTGTGLTIQHVSTDNAPTISETLSIASGATTFTFPTPQQSGTTYTISISSAAVGQVCRVLNPTGTVLGGTKTTLTDSSGTDLNTSGTTVDPNVTNIIINCESGAMISGTVTGYNGNGLRLRKQYTTGGTSPTPTDESIWISTNGSFAFPNLGTASQNYTISIQNNPWGPSQTCKIQDGNEAANTTSITATVASTPVDITDIVVTCTTNTYANLIVNIVNYASPIGAGLVVINNSSGVTANVSVGDTTANLDSNVESGKTYDISVSTQPTDHNCIVFNGQGTVWGSGTTNVYINCEPKYNEVVTYHWSARGYYRLGEASGSFADSIATAANASLNASSDAKYVGLGLISGDTNASAYFTGTGYAEAATTTKYDFTTNLSLEAWIVPYSLTGTIIDKGTNYSLNLNSGKVQLCVGGTCYESSATLTLGKKYHIIGTYYVGTNGARIYINGVKDSSHTSSVTASASSSKLRIGANSSGTNNFTGIIDDVSIYRYNLGDQRATLNYRWGSRLTTEYDFAGVLTDSSTYGNTVTATNSPSTVTDENGLANGAYSFSGTNQYMSISSGISTPYTQSFLTNKLTLSAWVMPTSTTSGYIVHSGDASSGYGLRVASNRLEVFSGTNVALSTTTLPTGKWIHVAAVRASNSWTLYLNGKQEATSNASATVTKPSSSSKFTIGADSSFSTNFNGSISRVKVYHAALSAAEIRNLAISVPTGILAYYSFSSGTGTDTGFIGNTGTYTNLGSDRLGLTVSAATFDGSQSFSLTPIGFSNSQSSTRTLCAWVNWSTLPTSGQTQTIMQYTDTVGLSVTNTGGTYSLNVEGFSANLTTPATSSWYHICAASNGSSYTLYQDGTALTNTATVYNATGSITKLQIGQNITSANGFNGSIDDIRIYNRALIASEITALSGNK